MKKMILFCLSILLFACKKDTQDTFIIEVDSLSYLSNSANYELCSDLYELYFDFFNGEIEEDDLESQVYVLYGEHGLDIDYEEYCELSVLCREYSMQNQNKNYISLDDLLVIFSNDNLTNEEKLLLCIEAAAINCYNRHTNCVLVMETSDGTFLLENNPTSYVQDYGIDISSKFAIVYQPYNTNSFSLISFSKESEFLEYLGSNYYANEETEDDCLKTYRENIEQAEMDWAIHSLSATIYLVGGPKVYGCALFVCFVEYQIQKRRCWREYVDCLESLQKVVFVKP